MSTRHGSPGDYLPRPSHEDACHTRWQVSMATIFRQKILAIGFMLARPTSMPEGRSPWSVDCKRCLPHVSLWESVWQSSIYSFHS